MIELLEENDDWVVNIQHAGDCVFWHIEVKRWNIGVYRRMLIGFYDYLAAMPDKTHLAPYVSKQQAKFMAMLGFEWHGDAVATEGGEMVNVWRIV